MKTNSFLKKIAWGLVIFIGLSNAVSAQKIQVNGKVMLAADSSALPGVTIRIKNTNIGVVSNSQGNYTIQANIGDTLHFSFIGLEIQNIPVKERKLNVYLKEDEMKQPLLPDTESLIMKVPNLNSIPECVFVEEPCH